MHRQQGLAAAAVLMATAGAGAIPTDVRVVRMGAAPGGNGLTWATAYADLEPALAEAATAGSGITQIWVSSGSYVPSRRTDPSDPHSATFQLVSGVAILG